MMDSVVVCALLRQRGRRCALARERRKLVDTEWRGFPGSRYMSASALLLQCPL